MCRDEYGSLQAAAQLAEQAAAGFAIAFFQATAPGLPSAPTAADLAPLKVMANEFRGELQADYGTVPQGAAKAWSFVRGEDLGLRVGEGEYDRLRGRGRRLVRGRRRQRGSDDDPQPQILTAHEAPRRRPSPDRRSST